MNRGQNLVGGGFGRRGADLTKAPSFVAPAGPTPARRYEEEEYSDPSRSPFRAAAILFLAMFGIICLEAMFSSTSLITPINSTFLNGMRGIGFVVGIPLAIFTVLKPQEPMGLLKKMLIILFLPVLTGFSAGEIAWRVSDWTEFGFSSAAFTPASYPVTYASHGRKGRRDSFEIDPFGLKEGTDIPVPSAQFDAIWPNHSDYCITVMQRQSASGAIEIKNDGVFTLSEPAPVTLSRCPEAQRLQEALNRDYRQQRSRLRP
jgi:hypothetical protein